MTSLNIDDLEHDERPSKASGGGAPVLGIDVGGTKILGGIMSRSGEVLFEKRAPTRRDHLLESVVEMAELVADEARRTGLAVNTIGIGTTGFVDRERGVLVQSINLDIEQIDIASAVAKATGLSVVVDNDVHAATLGELYFGAGRTYADFLFYNAGTGVATGMVFGGRLYRGASNAAGENGHISSDQSGTTLSFTGMSGDIERLLLDSRAGKDTVAAYLPNIEPPSAARIRLSGPQSGATRQSDEPRCDHPRRRHVHQRCRRDRLGQARGPRARAADCATRPRGNLSVPDGPQGRAHRGGVPCHRERGALPVFGARAAMTLMMESILEQPAALARVLENGLNADALADAFSQRNIRKVWITGSGTSLFAAMIAARSWERDLDIDCEAISALEFLDKTDIRGLGPDTMLLAISQSGASLILLEGVRRAKAAGALTVTITADPLAPIPAEAGFTVAIGVGPETNLAKCKGFTTSAFAAVLLGRRLAMGAVPNADAVLQKDHAAVPDLFSSAIDTAKDAAAVWAMRLRNADALYVVGAGANVASASEGALKVLEVAKMPVVTKELEEMMHGPINGVGPATGVIVVADASARRQRLAALQAGTALIGVTTISIFGSPDLTDTAPDLLLPACDDEAVRAILAVVPFQLLAHDLAAARGAAIDTARYPQLYPVFASKSIHQVKDDATT